MVKGEGPEPPAAASADAAAAAPKEVPRSDAPPAPPVQPNPRTNADAAGADSHADQTAPVAKPGAPPAESTSSDAPVKQAIRNAQAAPEASAPSPPAAPARPAIRQPAPDQAAAAAAALSRGDAMLAMRNITAARSLYEYAANAGNARAAAALAETYDPVFSTVWALWA